ncbi:glycosyltransferase family 9 protein [Thermosulfuriphilus ammonigenes]|uniref:Glycosyltransferase family 9 protein n=1 Tax=Thermosulfuriphilus ammonigenes TaxID=1936021 RepID=A0A6G7PXM3_9BACT|nr:glycosyltransferase family 9 protein [Thermosulfuriphilus ammonigenes]MBA2849629.1 hypothetical protein [Thermosulfuriphilus ammonigenes]QIJ72271.1 glycosyltransferase family 9 protein [Thermosulfuriphilus ammonigenes]
MALVIVWHEGALGDLILSRLAIGALAERAEVFLFARSDGRVLFKDFVSRVASTEPLAPLFLGRIPPFLKEVREAYLFFHSPPQIPIRTLKEAGIMVRVIDTRPQRPESAAYFQRAQVGGKEALFLLKGQDGPREGVFIHPGSGSPYKNYSLERFLLLAQALRSEGHQVHFILGPAEAHLQQSLKEAGENPLVGLSLEELAELLSEARLYVGNDSGVSHLAAAVGAPTLAIFGPSDPRIWAPIGPRVLSLRLDICPPCWPKPCDERICLEKIGLEDLLEAARSLL